MHYDPAPHLPGLIIVDVAEPASQFETSVSNLEVLGIDLDTAIADLIDNLQRRQTAMQSVQLSNQEILHSFEHDALKGDVGMYVVARDSLCREMFRQFCLLGLYVNDVLYYQFKELFKGALVLQKIEVPFTDATHRARHLARQAALAHQRYVPRVEAQVASARARSFGVVEQHGSRSYGTPSGSISIRIDF